MGALFCHRILFSLALLVEAAAAHGAAAGRLSTSYYRRSCPRVEQIVSDVVAAKQSTNPSMAAGMLRLVGVVGGPRFPILLGRLDARRFDARDVEGNLPHTNMSARAIILLFTRKGMASEGHPPGPGLEFSGQQNLADGTDVPLEKIFVD